MSRLRRASRIWHSGHKSQVPSLIRSKTGSHAHSLTFGHHGLRGGYEGRVSLSLTSEADLGGRRSQAMGVLVGVAVALTPAAPCSQRATPGRSASSRRNAVVGRGVILTVQVEAPHMPVRRSAAGSGARRCSRHSRSGHATRYAARSSQRNPTTGGGHLWSNSLPCVPSRSKLSFEAKPDWSRSTDRARY